MGISYSAAVDIAVVDEAIESEAWDWFRYTWFSYILWTPSDAETICRKILRVPGLQHSVVFICALDTNDGFGSLPPAMWEWLKRDRGFGPLQVWTPPDVVQPALPSFPPPRR